MRIMFILAVLSWLLSCSSPASQISIHDQFSQVEKIEGKASYAQSPFVAAGDRVYVVGHQDGTFPDLGWHVKGEMGGVWNHPIKLLDGYQLAMGVDGQAVMCLPSATNFYNFPMASQHVYPNIDGIAVSSLVFVPDGVEGAIIEYQLINTLDEPRNVELAFDVFVDLRPVWLAEKKELEDGKDGGYWDQAQGQLIVKDSLNDWYAIIGSSQSVSAIKSGARCTHEISGKGVDYSLGQALSLKPGEKGIIQYFITGSYEKLDSARNLMETLRLNTKKLVDDKQARYESLNRRHQMSSSDPSLDQMYEWVRYNTDWLVREVPEEGRGLSAGIPDYPWWFGTDNGYAIEGMLAYGMFEEAIATVDIICKLSDKANGASGQIMHEASTNGVVFNPGNLNTTPRFVTALWQTYAWTGSDSLLQAFWPRVKKGIEWIERQDRDGNGYPDGPGMMEIPGLHTEMVDVIAYQEQAYRMAAKFATAVGANNLSASYETKSDVLIEKLNSEWWSEEFNSFADFRSSQSEAIELTKAAIVRADTIDKPWSSDELKETLLKISSPQRSGTQAYVVHHNWVVNTPLETGAASKKNALKALETAEKYSNRFGMFVTGIDRDEEQEEATQWKSFSYVGAVMTLPTAVQAIGSANYGKIDNTYRYLENLKNSFSYALPGSMYEVSPDFGMIAQAWNAYAVAVPIVNHMVGIKPEAYLKRIIFQPQLPASLDFIQMNQIQVGSNRLDVALTREEGGLSAVITQEDPTYAVSVAIEGNLEFKADSVLKTKDAQSVLLSGREISLFWRATEKP